MAFAGLLLLESVLPRSQREVAKSPCAPGKPVCTWYVECTVKRS